MRHSGKLKDAFISDGVRTAYVEFLEVVEPRETLNRGIVHTAGLHFGDPVFLNDRENDLSILVRLWTPDAQPVLVPVDLVEGWPVA